MSVGWHDMGAARKKRVVVGKTEGAKHLSRTYATEADARRAASAEMSRMRRDPKKLTYSFALGRASIYPEQRVTRRTGQFRAWFAAGDQAAAWHFDNAPAALAARILGERDEPSIQGA